MSNLRVSWSSRAVLLLKCNPCFTRPWMLNILMKRFSKRCTIRPQKPKPLSMPSNAHSKSNPNNPRHPDTSTILTLQYSDTFDTLDTLTLNLETNDRLTTHIINCHFGWHRKRRQGARLSLGTRKLSSTYRFAGWGKSCHRRK